MSLSITDSPKFAITRTGLHIRDELSFEEWRGLAPKFSEAIKCAAFLIGDWLVYGEDHFRGQAAAAGLRERRCGSGPHQRRPL